MFAQIHERREIMQNLAYCPMHESSTSSWDCA
jgi:hypothetical protein